MFVLYYIILYAIELYYIVLNIFILYFIILYCYILLYCFCYILNHIIFHYILLYCIILHYITYTYIFNHIYTCACVCVQNLSQTGGSFKSAITDEEEWVQWAWTLKHHETSLQYFIQEASAPPCIDNFAFAWGSRQCHRSLSYIGGHLGQHVHACWTCILSTSVQKIKREGGQREPGTDSCQSEGERDQATMTLRTPSKASKQRRCCSPCVF